MQQQPDETASTSQAPRPSPWRGDADSWQIAVAEQVNGDVLEQAIAQAHETVHEARERWLAMPELQRPNWAVKWAAPVEVAEDHHGPEREHVWVMPLHWSPFRIEGVLLSRPVNELASGASEGELVSFAVQELSDWVHFHDGDPRGDRSGGFTIDALEAHYGQPPVAP